MIRAILSFFGGLFTLVTLGILAFAAAVGGVLWIYGRDLPNTDQLAEYTPPTISRIYSSEGRIIDEFARERRLFTPAEEIPDLVKQAFISAEDKNFYSHAGYDLRGMISAAIDAATGHGVRGASTIPQQVVKNFLLTSDRTAERKVKELILSVRMENTLNKDEILELYLNEIYLGQNSYGVTAAAQTYFNKPLEDLTAAEAAYLGALPQRPAYTHPVRDREFAVTRRNYVLREMFQNGYIDEDTYREARVSPLRSVQGGDFADFRSEIPPRDYFTDEIRRQLSRDYGEGEFFTGGLSVRATIDPELQEIAAASLRQALEEFDRGRGRWRGTGKTIEEANLGDWETALRDVKVARDVTLENEWFPAVVLDVGAQSLTVGVEGNGVQSVPREDIQWMRGDFGENFARGDVVHVRQMTSDDDGSFIRWSLRQVPEVQGAFVAMDVETGRVLSMQGGFSYQHSVFNRATQAMRQPGSSFKPFIYAAALDNGFSPATIVVDAPIEINTPQGVWRPKNYSNKFYGETPLRTGIEQSRNLMTVRLAEIVGMDVVARYAERFGVYDDMGLYLANSLGAEETTLYRMVAAYAMFANGGERVAPTLVDRVQNRYGETVYRHDQRQCVDCDRAELMPGESPRIVSNRERVIDAITAYQLTSMMQGVVERGTARGAVTLDVPVAGKTGTTNDNKDVWFVGFTSNIVAGCYIGYDQPRTLPGATGGGNCAPVFDRVMDVATEKYGGGEFEVPPGGQFININRYSGERMGENASGSDVVAEYFRLGEEPLFGVALDGGFAMSQNLPLADDVPSGAGQRVQNAAGQQTVIPKQQATFGTMSSGGLY